MFLLVRHAGDFRFFRSRVAMIRTQQFRSVAEHSAQLAVYSETIHANWVAPLGASTAHGQHPQQRHRAGQARSASFACTLPTDHHTHPCPRPPLTVRRRRPRQHGEIAMSFAQHVHAAFRPHINHDADAPALTNRI